MKTKISTIILTMLVLITNVVIAINDNEPDTNSKKIENKEISSIMMILPDGNRYVSNIKPGAAANSGLLDSSALETTEKDFSYLRFDVNNYIEESTPEEMELPVSEFKHLRFDVNQYEITNPKDLDELPDNSFNSLRFDVSSYSKNDTGSIGELPEDE